MSEVELVGGDIMPIYEYMCTNCKEQFEVMQKITDDPLTKCSSCEGELKKVITNTSFVLKGGGWYMTDYPSADRKKAGNAKTTSGKKSACTGKKNPLKLDK